MLQEQVLYKTGLLKICIFLCTCFADLNTFGTNNQIKNVLHDQLLRAKTDLMKTLIFNSRKRRGTIYSRCPLIKPPWDQTLV